MLLPRLCHSSRSSGTLGRLRSLYSFVIPFFGSTGLFSVGTSASLVNYSSVENISQARFLCEAGILTEKNFSSKLNKQIQTSGKSWCSRLATNYTAMGNDKWLGKSDPSSFSNPEDIRTESIHLEWRVDFIQKSISGSAQYNLQVLNGNATELIFDTRDLVIDKVTSDGNALTYKVGQTVSSFGEPLTIQVGDLVKAAGVGNKVVVQIDYSSTEKCTGLQWLDPLQTAGKKHPYVFSQCQAIHARSLMPCQDTPFVKAAYTANVSVPKDLQALMSAVLVGEPVIDGGNKVYKFEQKVPIPSYLTAIAVGDIVGKKIGPRSTVWAEKEVVDSAAYEFDATESMVAAGEKLLGKYVWGVYDILVLPPSFPYGGMENPCLTFATPTLLAGDKSLVNVIAHEIAHSWTGNLVTNKDWEHFWLNEGFTVFTERKILAALHGEKFRQFAAIEGWTTLTECVNQLKPDNSFTRLVQDLNGIDPDDAFSSIPYEKGFAFLYYLEQKVGGPTVFEPFLHQYIQNNSYKSIDSNVFKSTFIKYFQAAGSSDKIADIDWDSWFYTTGMPPVKNEYDGTLSEACTDLKKRWMQWDPSTPIPFKKSDVDDLMSDQITQFLQELVGETSLPLAKVQAMEKVYSMSSRKNCEIRFRWIRVNLKAHNPDIIPAALQFVNEQGRMKYVRPVYRDLYAWEEVRPQAIQNYKENSKYMMHVTAKMLLQDLHLN